MKSGQETVLAGHKKRVSCQELSWLGWISGAAHRVLECDIWCYMDIFCFKILEACLYFGNRWFGLSRGWKAPLLLVLNGENCICEPMRSESLFSFQKTLPRFDDASAGASVWCIRWSGKMLADEPEHYLFWMTLSWSQYPGGCRFMLPVSPSSATAMLLLVYVILPRGSEMNKTHFCKDILLFFVSPRPYETTIIFPIQVQHSKRGRFFEEVPTSSPKAFLEASQL